jgi:hypothetical protein
VCVVVIASGDILDDFGVFGGCGYCDCTGTGGCGSLL